MYLYSGHFEKLEALSMFTPVRLPHGEIGAVMDNAGIWTNVLLSDGGVQKFSRELSVEILTSNYQVVIAGLRRLERELKNETTA